MPENCTGRKTIYDDLRAINSLDLTRNEAKVLICYRIEMDEVSRQVRGKRQADLREKCGLSEQQFSIASGSLQRRGLIDVQRHRNAPQTVTVSRLEMHEQPLISDTPEIRDSENQEHGISGNRNPGFPETGTIEIRGDDIFDGSSVVSSVDSAVRADAALPPVTSLRTLSDRLHAAAGPCLAHHAIAPGLFSMLVPQMWLDHGADLDRDVIPVLQAIAAKGKRNIGSWDYFTRPVAEAKAKRLAGLPAVEVTRQADVLPFKVTVAMHPNARPRDEVMAEAARA